MQRPLNNTPQGHDLASSRSCGYSLPLSTWQGRSSPLSALSLASATSTGRYDEAGKRLMSFIGWSRSTRAAAWGA